jgi:hypothetical protein
MTAPITTNTNGGFGMLAASPMLGSQKSKDSGQGTWFEALANAWGQTLDGQANTIEQMSGQVGSGGDNPSQITQLTAESLKMSFLSQSSTSSIDSVGKALETMARKN